MNKISIEDAFKRENLDVNAVAVQGIPERHIEAVIAFAKLIVGADHVDGDGILDYDNSSQVKYNAVVDMRSRSGAGFSYSLYVFWHSLSVVGARLSFKERETPKYFFEKNKELFKSMMVYERNLKFLNDK